MKKITSILLAIGFITISCSSDDTEIEIVNLSIGDEYQGGIIFYLDETGQGGFIALQHDIGIAVWGCTGNTEPIAQGLAIGDGMTNTQAIVDYCDEEHYAAKLCYELDVNGYNDWFLPSIYELELMYEHRHLIGGLSISNMDVYSSSSEGTPTYSGSYLRNWVFDFSDPPVLGSEERKIFTSKTSRVRVRPIRSF